MSETTGRERFAKYRAILNIMVLFSRILPRSIISLIWRPLDILPGNLGVAVRYIILKRLLQDCGENIFIGPFVEIKGWDSIEIGDNVSIHSGCYIDGSGGLKIGNNTSIAHQSSILTFEHTWSNIEVPIKYNPLKKSIVSIGDDVWIGCGVRILSGTIINKRSILAAGAVVNKTVESNTLVGGIPAKKIKDLHDL